MPTLQNGKTHSNNSPAICQRIGWVYLRVNMSGTVFGLIFLWYHVSNVQTVRRDTVSRFWWEYGSRGRRKWIQFW